VANHRQAEKRNRQRIRRTERNKHFKSTMRTYIKRARAAIEAGDAAAGEAVKKAIAMVDRVAGKGIIPRRRGSRIVSRLTAAARKGQ